MGDGIDMTGKDFVFMVFSLAIIATAVAINQIMTMLPWVILAGGISISMVLLTATHCAIRYRKAIKEERFYIIGPPPEQPCLVETKRRLLK